MLARAFVRLADTALTVDGRVWLILRQTLHRLEINIEIHQAYFLFDEIVETHYD